MNITLTLKTKFNIGDRVYVANRDYEFYPNPKTHIIKDIFVDINRQRVRIMYVVEQNGISECIPEDCAFETYVECAKWCKEHN